MAKKLVTLVYLDRYVGGALLLAAKLPVIAAGFLLRRDHSLHPKGDILIIKLLGAGSLFIALPNLLELRRRFSDRRICLLTSKRVAGFAHVIKIFDEIHVIETDGFFSLAISIVKAIYRLFGIDTVIDLEPYSRGATLIAALLCARNRLAFFIDEPFWKRRIATHLLFLSHSSAVHQFYDQLFGLLSIAPAGRVQVRTHLLSQRLPIAPKTAGQRRICIGPACSDLARERQLTPTGWVYVLSKRFSPNDVVRFEVIGAPNDRAFGEKIADAIRGAFPSATVDNSCGVYKPAEVFSAIERADEFWGIDSLLLHIARALQKPTTSFWGPTAPYILLRDMSPELDHVFYEKISCSPCVHISARPPCRGDNICLQRISGVAESRERAPLWLVT
jgi:ADP-heptose:LPS heptosyltransferase